MNFHKIKVDDDVYRYLVQKIKDFNDTPNLVLRRELLEEKQNGEFSEESFSIPEFSPGIPVALQHILEVIYLVKEMGFNRVEATKRVGSRHQVKRETVLDKYTRQLNKTTREIDVLLQDQNLSKFKSILKKKFDKHIDLIEEFFSDLLKTKSQSIDKVSRTTKSTDKYVSLETLLNRGDDLSNSKPVTLVINEDEFNVKSWVEFDLEVVNWLINNNYLSDSDMPISATDKKDLLNSRRGHSRGNYDGAWRKVRDGIYLDTKYNAQSHVRNILNLLDQLSLRDKCKIRLDLR